MKSWMAIRDYVTHTESWLLLDAEGQDAAIFLPLRDSQTVLMVHDYHRTPKSARDSFEEYSAHCEALGHEVELVELNEMPAKKVTWTPVKEFAWPSWEDIGSMFTLTCKNHPFLRWSTKHPTYRHLHYLSLEDGVPINKETARYAWEECPCKYEDLRVIEEEGELATPEEIADAAWKEKRDWVEDPDNAI